jgi:hypothetical protein
VYAGKEQGGVIEIDEVEERRATLLISVNEDELEKKGEIVVVCRDAYDQEGQAIFFTPEPSLPSEPEDDEGGEGAEGGGAAEGGGGF